MFEQRDLDFIHKYFIAEKQESLFILILGITALVLAVVFWFLMKTNPSFYKGAAAVLVTVGLIQTIVGFNIYTRTDKQKTEIAYNIGMEPKAYAKHTELPRMEKVMISFVVYRWVEIAFIIIGITLIVLFRSNTGRSFWYGFGVAMLIQGALMLAADYFAEKRGAVYTKEIKKLTEG